MDSEGVTAAIESLDYNIGELREVLAPILDSPLSETAGRLPILDKAQLFVLWAYALESITFSYLRLNGIDAKEHPIFTELTRVKQYFGKIQGAVSSTSTSKPNMQLDKAAADRIIKHALGGTTGPFQASEEAQTKTEAKSSMKRDRFDSFASNGQERQGSVSGNGLKGNRKESKKGKRR
ncbi:uncharacterized protein KY384_001100 [Bacidia gigantensis]|uniref:uncharacterized protein n=1 Tax=Bacidia gigantensis TaxID=2732470 RepID=UPI001D053D21|nr:uncharacterized protein KY384_001100 [Bacidia gigantensis]KAG8534256.1 hypothetical protein KY384_001100 [Bacidia gigantensis]